MQTKKIIVLYGRGDIGKTDTLRMVTDKLEGLPLSFTQTDLRKQYVYEGKSIVVTTWGDNAAEMAKNIAFMKEHPFDVAITAARSHGQTHELIKAYAKAIGCGIIWKKKYAANNPTESNMEYAEMIMKLISESGESSR